MKIDLNKTIKNNLKANKLRNILVAINNLWIQIEGCNDFVFKAQLGIYESDIKQRFLETYDKKEKSK